MNDIRNQTEKLIITKTLIGGRLSAPTDSQHFLFNSDGSLCLASILRLVNGGFLVGKMVTSIIFHFTIEIQLYFV